MRRLLVLGAAALLVLGGCSNGGENEPEPGATTTTVLYGVNAGPPPWGLEGEQVERMESIGITPLRAEGSAVHYHAHIDVFYDGDEVAVPANIGIDYQKSRISPLHTHYDSGVIHVEAEEDEEFTLGQFLTQWGVKADGGCVADKCADEVAVFVNGSIQDEDAADLVIEADTQIALVLGTERADIPSGYDCSSAPQDACPKTPAP